MPSCPPAPEARAARPDDLPTLAALHAGAFPDDPWDAERLAPLAFGPGAITLMLPGGFILMRVAADEAEVITIAVDPTARRRGLGRRLLAAGLATAFASAAAAVFLEVATDNAAALALYAASGFIEVGRRKRYYHRGTAPAVDALVLKREATAPGFD